jgi:hypothetical protein
LYLLILKFLPCKYDKTFSKLLVIQVGEDTRNDKPIRTTTSAVAQRPG